MTLSITMLCHYPECRVLFIGMPNAIRRRGRFYVLASNIEGATKKVYQCIMSTEVNFTICTLAYYDYLYFMSVNFLYVILGPAKAISSKKSQKEF